jgi:copper chaperone NosL
MKKFAALLVLLSACEKDEGPVPIALGEDGCGLCRMIISEAPYAAQMRTNQVEKYDDIGCLIERLSKGASPKEIWVADFASRQWVDARSASYVHAPNHYTPMASGIVAFSNRDQAQAWAAKEQGRVLSFEEIRLTRRTR